MARNRKRIRVAPYTGPSLPGIDVSHHQGKIDWDRVAAEGIRFAYIRAYDGKTKDREFVRNWLGARRVGIKRGAYVYFRADRDGETQAVSLLNLLEEFEFSPDDLVPAMDLERKSGKNLKGGIYTGPLAVLPPELVLTETNEWLEVIESELGASPLFYGGEYVHWAGSVGRPDLVRDFDRCPLWAALSHHPTRAKMPARNGEPFPWKEWTVHQTTSKGRIVGIRNPVDLDVYRGDDLTPLTLAGGRKVREARERTESSAPPPLPELAPPRTGTCPGCCHCLVSDR